jgi:hypothetical protein
MLVKVLKGSVVKAAAGRDDGGYFVVTDLQGDFCLIADGKSLMFNTYQTTVVQETLISE